MIRPQGLAGASTSQRVSADAFAHLPLWRRDRVAAALLSGDELLLYLAELAMINVVIAVGLNLLSGNCGQISLCNASFMAVGARVQPRCSRPGWACRPHALPASAAISRCSAPRSHPAAAVRTLSGFGDARLSRARRHPDRGISRLHRRHSRPACAAPNFRVQLPIQFFALSSGARPYCRRGARCPQHSESRYGRAFDAVRQSPFAAQALGIPVGGSSSWRSL